VLIHQSEFCESNAVVVQGRASLLLIDPGVQRHEMACLANDLRELGQPTAAGFSTHPHWDHLLWHARLGASPRYGTARCAAAVRVQLSDAHWKARIAPLIPPDIAEEVPLDLLGLITGLPAETAWIPWDGPQVRIMEHEAHAPGHAALLIEERGVLVAGDMLSDVLIPMLNLNDTAARLKTTSPRCSCSKAWRAMSMSSSRVTGPSAELIRYAHGSNRTARTCMPCVTPVFPTTRGSAHWPLSARIGCPACMNGNYSTSPEEGSATGRPDRDPPATQYDPAKFLTQDTEAASGAVSAQLQSRARCSQES
jgi:hypothetical protein